MICSEHKEEIEKKVREICTYHSDGGTSGYNLSEEQFTRIFDLFEDRCTQAHAQGYSKGHDTGYKEAIKELPASYKKGQADERNQAVSTVKSMMLPEDGNFALRLGDGSVISPPVDGFTIKIYNQAVKDLLNYFIDKK